MSAQNIYPLFDDAIEAPAPEPIGPVRRALDQLKHAWEEEQAQRPLWIPVLWAAGAAGYFSMPLELPLVVGLFVLAALACAAVYLKAMRPLLVIMALIVLGFVAAQLKTSFLETPMIAEKQPPRVYIATVTQIEKRVEGGWRLHLDAPAVPGEALDLPRKIRLVVRTDIPRDLAPGMRVSLRAVLTPLPRSVLPGGYDFGRQLFLKGYGATGFAVSGVSILGETPAYNPPAFAAAQASIGAAIEQALDGSSAGLAKALLLGDKSAIPQEIKDSYRQAGLAHLLAISGLHMALVASFVFLVIRQGLSFAPVLALSLPLKSLAAGASILVLLGYLGLVGAPISAQRATVMAACVMLAIIVGRSAISLRTAALAGIGLLFFWPENVVDIGFQMSFAAVIALISGYEAAAKPVARMKETLGPVRARIFTYGAGILLSTILAEIAVFPLSLYHFNEITVYGLAGNAFAVPLTAFWIMPAGLVGVVLTPLGFSEPAFFLMGLGLDVVTAMTQNIAAAPGAFIAAKSPPTVAVAVFFSGGLLLCLMKTWLRFFGLPLLAVAPLLNFMGPGVPNVLVSDTGSSYAVDTHNDGFVLLRGRRSSFSADVWARQMGQVGFQNVAALYQRCDMHGCSVGLWPDEAGHLKALPLDAWPMASPPYRLEYLRKPSGLADSCGMDAFVIATFDMRGACPQAITVLDAPALNANGPFALALRTSGNNEEMVKPISQVSTPASNLDTKKSGTSAKISKTKIDVQLFPAFVATRPWHPKSASAMYTQSN